MKKEKKNQNRSVFNQVVQLLMDQIFLIVSLAILILPRMSLTIRHFTSDSQTVLTASLKQVKVTSSVIILGMKVQLNLTTLANTNIRCAVHQTKVEFFREARIYRQPEHSCFVLLLQALLQVRSSNADLRDDVRSPNG